MSSAGISISFTPEIIAHAKARGLTLTPEEVGKIDANINTIARVEESTVAFRLDQGRTVTLDQAVEMMSVGYGKLATAKVPEMQRLPTTATTTERAVAMNAAIRAGSDGAKRSQAEALVRNFGNPWRTGNSTHRAYITNTHPELAAQLKAQAGTR